LEEEVASKVKITIGIDESLLREFDDASRQERKSRGRPVGEGLQYWRRSRLEQELKEGYQAMAREDRVTAERTLAAGWEAIR
jgi:metal-responsive CopG/Arc/MetJ family transcriptional regulator